MVSVSPSNLDMKKLVIDSSFACGSSSINIVTASTLQRAGRIKSSPRPRDAGGKRRGPMVRSQGSGMLHRWRGTVMGEIVGMKLEDSWWLVLHRAPQKWSAWIKKSDVIGWLLTRRAIVESVTLIHPPAINQQNMIVGDPRLPCLSVWFRCWLKTSWGPWSKAV